MTEFSKKLLAIIIAVVFACLMLGTGVVTMRRLSEQNDMITQLRNEHQQFFNQLSNNDAELQNSLDAFKQQLLSQIEQESRGFFDEGFSIQSANPTDNTAIVDIYFSLKEAPVSEEVTISLGSGSDYQTVSASMVAAGRYTARVELDIMRSYDISYSVTLSTVRSEKLMTIDIQKSLKERFYTEHRLDFVQDSDRGGKELLVFYVVNKYGSAESLKLFSGKLELFRGQTVVKTIDILEYEIDDEDGVQTFLCKEMAISSQTKEEHDLANPITLKLTLVDNFGMTYYF